MAVQHEVFIGQLWISHRILMKVTDNQKSSSSLSIFGPFLLLKIILSKIYPCSTNIQSQKSNLFLLQNICTL